MTSYAIIYDFGEHSGFTSWLLLRDGIVLSSHGSWEEAEARRRELEQGRLAA